MVRGGMGGGGGGGWEERERDWGFFGVFRRRVLGSRHLLGSCSVSGLKQPFPCSVPIRYISKLRFLFSTVAISTKAPHNMD